MSARHLAQVKHILIYLNGELSLIEQQADCSYEERACNASAALDSTYKRLKTLSHIAVTMNMLVAQEDSQVQLRHLNEKLKQLISIHHAELVPYLDFISQSTQLNEQLLMQWDNKQELIAKYNEEMGPVLKHYAKEATYLQFACLDTIMQDWGAEYDIEPEASRVLIVCPHGAREQLIEQQFFDSWMQRARTTYSSSNKGLIYMVEMLPEQMSNIRKIDDLIWGFLSKQELNKTIGKQLLGDELAMLKDVLGEHATAVLHELEEKKSSCPYHLK